MLSGSRLLLGFVIRLNFIGHRSARNYDGENGLLDVIVV